MLLATYIYTACLPRWKLHTLPSEMTSLPIHVVQQMFSCSHTKLHIQPAFSLASRDEKAAQRVRSPKSPRVHSGPLCKGFRTPDPEGNVMNQSTEMSPLVSMMFQTFLNPLKFLMEVFNILVSLNVSLYFS